MGSGSCHILHRPPCLQSIPVPICNGHEDQRYILQYSSCHLSRWFDGHSLLQDVHCSGKVPLCVSVCVLARVWTLYYTVKHHYVQTYTFLYCDNQNIYITYFAGIFFFIAFPLLNYIRQPKGSVLVFVLVWVLCIVSAALAVTTEDVSRLIIHAFFPAPVLIVCLAGTIKALPAATSVSIEEKRRIVGTLVLLLFNYFLINLPAVNLSIYLSGNTDQYCIAFLIFFLFNHFVDFTLFIFMQNGPIDKLLECMYCCSFAAADISSRSSVWLMVAQGVGFMHSETKRERDGDSHEGRA